MFDHLYCDYPLPDGELQEELFQTKDLHLRLDTFRITKEGKFKAEVDGGLLYNKGDYLNVNGEINFYTSKGKHSDNTFKWYEYKAIFQNGKLQLLEKIS